MEVVSSLLVLGVGLVLGGAALKLIAASLQALYWL